jgi:hypothetical protein
MPCTIFVLQSASVAASDLGTCATCGQPELGHARPVPTTVLEAAGQLADDYRLSGALGRRLLGISVVDYEGVPSIGVHVRSQDVEVPEEEAGYHGFFVVRCYQGQPIDEDG